MNILLKSKTITLLTILAIAYVFLAIVGGFKMYSSVPYWDMWEGYLEFGLRAQDLDLSVWWSQFNEHRIFLSRILFWLDLFLFNGKSIFLILCNYLLGGAIFYCFYKILKTAFPKERRLRYCLSLYTLAITFSWIQEENYTCAFQSQFLLAYLLPLIGFYCLYLSKEENRVFFLIACIAGIASAGTMVNGVIALPLMTALAFFLKIEWKKIAVLGILASFILCIYFYDYKSISHHASLTNSLFHQTFAFIKFYLLMIGSPFVYINGSNYLIGVNKLGVLAGLFFNISLLYFMYLNLIKKSSSLQLVLISFISYVGITTIAITGGRLGIQLPTTPRYLTPILMAWTALLVLFVLNMQKSKRLAIGPILSFILIILLPWQYLSIYSRRHIIFEREIEALAAKIS